MLEARNLRLAIGAAGIVDRNLHDLQAPLGRSKNKSEIAERVKMAEIGTPLLETHIIAPAQSFGAAKRIGEALRQEPSERDGESFVCDEIQKAHRIGVH